jgi:hypothetical protein
MEFRVRRDGRAHADAHARTREHAHTRACTSTREAHARTRGYTRCHGRHARAPRRSASWPHGRLVAQLSSGGASWGTAARSHVRGGVVRRAWRVAQLQPHVARRVACGQHVGHVRAPCLRDAAEAIHPWRLARVRTRHPLPRVRRYEPCSLGRHTVSTPLRCPHPCDGHTVSARTLIALSSCVK